jgi:homospermidine synthase
MLELIEDASIDRLKALALFYGPSAGRSSTGKGGKEEPMPLAQLRAQLEGMKLVRFRGKMLIIGLGSIGMGIIPLLVRHFEFGQGNDGALPIRVLTGEDRRECAETIKDKFGISYTLQCLTPSNYGDVLGSFGLTSGDLIVNLSVDVSSRDVVLWSQARGVLYVDTVTEPWPGTYDNAELPISARTNYSLREESKTSLLLCLM